MHTSVKDLTITVNPKSTITRGPVLVGTLPSTCFVHIHYMIYNRLVTFHRIISPW